MDGITRYIDYLFERRLMLHIIYWVCVFIFLLIYGLGHGQPIPVSFYVHSVNFPFQISAYYCLVGVQLPLLFDQKFMKFGIITLIASYLFYLGAHINYDFGVGRKLISWHKPHSLSEILASGEFYFRGIVDIYIVVLTTAIIKFLKDTLESRSKIELLNKEMAQVQYHTIISELDSDLVIDTLDTIISKSDAKASDLPETVAGLSTVLDDILYKAPGDQYQLIQEIELIKNYIELHNKVYSKHQISSLDQMVQDPAIAIPAMSFQKPLSLLLKNIRGQVASTQIEILIIQEPHDLVMQIGLDCDGGHSISQDKLLSGLSSIASDQLKSELVNEDSELFIKLSYRL